MEHSPNHSAAEGFSSSESGWTTYIASPMKGEDSGCTEASWVTQNDKIARVSRSENRRKEGSDDSDGSMASDASSGPSHHREKHGKDGCSKPDKTETWYSNDKSKRKEKKKGKASAVKGPKQ
ncbi:protein SOB FIVE-LIKE 4-like [Rhodamnia argentea]|uniref:Protein SOB FIVE-LIKE 4-like n=1 Tax=Rhodamnia argentea TaxID=178133 RepID=A0A8B8QWZ3_9MYRT|nr:protein SOB FIVE-LIKE 4-like [Rhodamnia argentea]